MTPEEDINAQALGVFERAAQHLVRDAKLYGLVLTITQRPLLPLAMGNYEAVVEVRPVLEREK